MQGMTPHAGRYCGTAEKAALAKLREQYLSKFDKKAIEQARAEAKEEGH
jgi:hypothetical protein